MKARESAPAHHTADFAIDVVSDVVCPWCYIGKRKLESALTELKSREPRLRVAVRWHPFQLNPDLPPEGIDRQDYLRAKFGSGARSEEIYARVKRVGEEVGIPFAFERISRVPNTLEAHTAIAWAQSHDAAAADALVETLFRAFFVEGRFPGDRRELSRIVSAAGLRWDEAEASLASLRAQVEAQDRESREAGINGVPFFVFGGKSAVAGAHDPPTLLRAIAAARAAV